MFILILIGLLFSTPVHAQDFVLMKGSGSAVYAVSGGYRYAFPTPDVYYTYFGRDFSRVVTVHDNLLSSYQLKSNILFPNGTLIKIESDPRVYEVMEDGIEWIQTEQDAINKFGYDWAKKVHDVPVVYFTDYAVRSVSQPIVETPVEVKQSVSTTPISNIEATSVIQTIKSETSERDARVAQLEQEIKELEAQINPQCLEKLSLACVVGAGETLLKDIALKRNEIAGLYGYFTVPSVPTVMNLKYDYAGHYTMYSNTGDYYKIENTYGDNWIMYGNDKSYKIDSTYNGYIIY